MLNVISPTAATTLPTKYVEQAVSIIHLPWRNSGHNIPLAHLYSPAFYMASYMSSADDTLLEKYKPSLLPTLLSARDRFVSLTGLDSAKPSPVSAIFPADCSKLLKTSYTSRIYKSLFTRGIMGVLTSFIQSVLVLRLRQSVIPPDGTNISALTRQQKSEILHILANTSRGRITQVITANLAYRYNRIDADSLRAIMCYNLGIPVHPYGSTGVDGFPYPVLKCPKDNAFFDVSGDHAAACSYCHSARSATHRGLRDIFALFTREAHFITTSEPNTYSILSGLFSSPMQLAALFPKHSNAVVNRRHDEIQGILSEIRNAPDINARQAIIAKFVSDERIRPIPRNEAGETDGIARRADLMCVPDDGKGITLLVDTTGIHDSTKDLIGKQLDYHLRLHQHNSHAFASGYELASNAGNSPIVENAAKIKHKRYGLIADLANIGASGRGPQIKMKFVAAAITHRCEMAEELINTIEHITGRYKASLFAFPDIDGRTPARAAASFRSRFKTALCVQIARGFGRQLRATAAMSLSAAAHS